MCNNKCSMMGSYCVNETSQFKYHSVRVSYNCSCNLVMQCYQPSFFPGLRLQKYHEYHVVLKQQVIVVLINFLD